MAQQREKKKKKLYFEVMRFAAILLVMFNHTAKRGFLLFGEYDFSMPHFWIYQFVTVFCKLAVPLFFMITGALMLNREDEPLKDLFLKRILKYGLVLLVISVIYWMEDCLVFHKAVPLTEFVGQVYHSEYKVHLWFLYSYITFLLALPFLRSLVRNLENKYFVYLIGLGLFFQTLPLLEYALIGKRNVLNSDLKPTWLLAEIVLYPCVGYYLEHRMSWEKAGKKLLFLWIPAVTVTMVCCYLTYVRAVRMDGVITSEKSQVFFKNADLINSLTVYLTIRLLFLKIRPGERLERVLLSLGGSSFGVYLLHQLILSKQPFLTVYGKILNTGINRMIGIWVYILFIYLICYITTLILKKIPVLRMLVGG